MNEEKIGRRNFLKTAVISASTVGAASLAVAQTRSGTKTDSRIAMLPHKELGSTGAKVPILMLGASQRLDPVYDKIMHRCFKEGVTAIDTALSYGWGSSHKAVNNFIKQIGDRKKLWITSKSGSSSPRGLASDLDEALEELGTDYLDLYFMHGINDEDMLDKDYLVLGDKLRKSGKTRFFGFSCHDGNVAELMNKAAKVGGIDAILFRYNFRRYGDLELNRAIDACKNAGIGLIAMKTYGSVPENIQKVVQFTSQNFSIDQAKLKSVWADDRIDSIVSEMDSLRVVRENIAAAKSEEKLSANEFHQLNQLAALTSSYACNGCSQYCESVLQNKVAIADPLRFLMYYECYGKEERARELFHNIPIETRQFNRSELARASAVCPQGINIASRLSKAYEALT
ncbi:MAG: aldo/keto reductase [SAR324 cluster bacterium]|nr:aldo/keto reductase [SAR324 cluster bacterium]